MIFHVVEPVILLGFAVAFVVGLLAHNLAITWVSRLLGDRTPEVSGFRTLALPRHMSIYGAVAMAIGGQAWAEPPPVDERWRAARFKRAVALLCGPLALLGLSCATLVGFRLSRPLAYLVGSERPGFDGLGVLPDTAGRELLLAVGVCLMGMFVFSLLPIPPLTGGRVMLLLAPPTLGWQKARYQLVERNIGLGIALGLVLLPLLLNGFPSVVEQLAEQLVQLVAGGQ